MTMNNKFKPDGYALNKNFNSIGSFMRSVAPKTKFFEAYETSSKSIDELINEFITQNNAIVIDVKYQMNFEHLPGRYPRAYHSAILIYQ